jgi:protein-S-isoprenylcysteine O-methyltransferase Ste14
MTNLLGSLYGNETVLQAFFVTCLIGGGAAWATGRALANSWRPFGQAVVYLLLLGAAIHFAHFALFQGELLSLPSYVSDTAFLICVGGLGWRLTQARRMVTQYRWLYERSGPFTWRARGMPQANDKDPS